MLDQHHTESAIGSFLLLIFLHFDNIPGKDSRHHVNTLTTAKSPQDDEVATNEKHFHACKCKNQSRVLVSSFKA